MLRKVSRNLFPFLWSHDFKRTFQCLMPLSVTVLRCKLREISYTRQWSKNRCSVTRRRCQKQNQLLKFAAIAVKNEWLRNNLRKIVSCNSPFRTAQESWHDWQKRKLLKAKPSNTKVRWRCLSKSDLVWQLVSSNLLWSSLAKRLEIFSIRSYTCVKLPALKSFIGRVYFYWIAICHWTCIQYLFRSGKSCKVPFQRSCYCRA